MFDVTNPISFENIRNWTESIKTHLSSEVNNTPVIIIGNKIDLVEREIKTDEAEKYCNDLGFKYFETSAKTGENVSETIKYLVKEVLKKNIKKNKQDVFVLKSGGVPKPPPDSKKEGNCPCIII